MSENIKLMTNEVQSKKGRVKEEGGREGGRGREERVSYFTRSVVLLFK